MPKGLKALSKACHDRLEAWLKKFLRGRAVPFISVSGFAAGVSCLTVSSCDVSCASVDSDVCGSSGGMVSQSLAELSSCPLVADDNKCRSAVLACKRIHAYM